MDFFSKNFEIYKDPSIRKMFNDIIAKEKIDKTISTTCSKNEDTLTFEKLEKVWDLLKNKLPDRLFIVGTKTAEKIIEDTYDNNKTPFKQCWGITYYAPKGKIFSIYNCYFIVDDYAIKADEYYEVTNESFKKNTINTIKGKNLLTNFQ